MKNYLFLPITLSSLSLVNSIELNNSTAPSSSSSPPSNSNNCDQIQTVFKFENDNTTDSSSNEFFHQQFQHNNQHPHLQQQHQQSQQQQQHQHQQNQLQLSLSLDSNTHADFSTAKVVKQKANSKLASGKPNKKDLSGMNKKSAGRAGSGANSKQTNNFMNGDLVPNKKFKKCNAKISSLKSNQHFDEFDNESNEMNHKSFSSHQQHNNSLTSKLNYVFFS